MVDAGEGAETVQKLVQQVKTVLSGVQGDDGQIPAHVPSITGFHGRFELFCSWKIYEEPFSRLSACKELDEEAKGRTHQGEAKDIEAACIFKDGTKERLDANGFDDASDEESGESPAEE